MFVRRIRWFCWAIKRICSSKTVLIGDSGWSLTTPNDNRRNQSDQA
jgi:hypothetical protein